MNSDYYYGLYVIFSIIQGGVAYKLIGDFLPKITMTIRIIISLVVAIVAAIGIYYFYPPPTPSNGKCTSDSDCPSGQVCQNGTCITPIKKKSQI